MIFGTISLIIGGIIFIITLIAGNLFGYVCASIFIVGGLIMVTIKKCADELKPATKEEEKPVNRGVTGAFSQ